MSESGSSSGFQPEVGRPRASAYSEWKSYRPAKRRQTLSLSMAGKCRMNLWLAARGAEAEPFTPSAERVFEYGDALEELMFEERRFPDHHSETGFRTIGNWYQRTARFYEPTSDVSLEPGEVQLRQMEVSLGEFKGHIDGVDVKAKLNYPGGSFIVPVLLDAKSANGNSFRGASHGKLAANVFSREYLIQMNMYMAALRKSGLFPVIQDTALLYMDKEKGGMMFRLVVYDQSLVDEGLERLMTGCSPAEPRPDFDWDKGSPIHMRCGYCEYKYSCAETRGQLLSQPQLGPRGRPIWTVLS